MLGEIATLALIMGFYEHKQGEAPSCTRHRFVAHGSRLRTFTYAGEGWGLANDGRVIYMSDGSAYIRCLDPVNFTETRRILVHDGKSPVTELNELECVHGEIYANVWHTWRIVRISPVDGSVIGWIDCREIIAPQELNDPEAVLNGIAYDSMGDRLFVTGKLWPKLFEITLTPKK